MARGGGTTQSGFSVSLPPFSISLFVFFFTLSLNISRYLRSLSLLSFSVRSVCLSCFLALLSFHFIISLSLLSLFASLVYLYLSFYLSLHILSIFISLFVSRVKESALRPRFLLYVQYLAGCRDSNPRFCDCSQVCYH